MIPNPIYRIDQCKVQMNALLKKTRAGYSINPEHPYLFLAIRPRMISLELLVLQFLMYMSSDIPDLEMTKEGAFT